MKDELKLSYWDFAMTIIIMYLVPIIFNQIIVELIKSYTPEMYSSLERSENAITKHFIDFKFAAYIIITLFVSLALGILKVLGIFKHYGIPLLFPLLIIYPFMPYVEKLDIYSTLLNIFLIPFSLTFVCHYYVLRTLFANFPKIKKIAYVSMIILFLIFIFVVFTDSYYYSINKFGYQYNIDNLYSMISIIPRFITLFAFVALFIIFISAYVYYWKNRHNLKTIRPKGL